MPPVVVTCLGFLFMLALLVGVQLLVRKASWWARAAGALAGYLVCALFFLVAMLGHGRQEQTLRVKVDASGPADAAGLRDGDLVLAVNSERPAGWSQLRAMIVSGGGDPVDLEVERGTETLRFEIQPRDGVIGVASVVERHELPLGLAVATAVAAPVFTVVTKAREMTGPRTVMGPVGILERDPSPWPYFFRLGELGSYAWPVSIFVAFALSRRRKTP